MSSDINLNAHLLRMRATAIFFLLVVVVAVVAVFALPYKGSSLASPAVITLVAVAACLWIGFSANRDAAIRLRKIREVFAVHGDEARLLRDHWLVYVVIAVRLEMMVVAGSVVGLWGLGPKVGVSLMALGGLMIALTWPTARKAQLLLGRARSLRENG